MKNKILEYLKTKQPIILLVVVFILLISNCNQRNREKEIIKLQKKNTKNIVSNFNSKLDSLYDVWIIDLKIEGLKGELRAIEASDRRIFDKDRQTEIRKEIDVLEKEKK